MLVTYPFAILAVIIHHGNLLLNDLLYDYHQVHGSLIIIHFKFH